MNKNKKIIIGVAGEIASGKTTAANYLKKKYDCDHLSFSGVLRDIFNETGIELSRENLQKFSLALRKQFGEDIISQGVLRKIEKSDKNIIVLESIRRIEDLSAFKNFPAYLVFIKAGAGQSRYERITKRSENADDQSKTWEEFQKDAQKETETTIAGLESKADFILQNKGDLEEFYGAIDGMMEEILGKE